MSSSDFAIDETVLAYHGSCIYSAKIVRTQPQPTGEALFFVHYLGWNKKWDEWVPASRVLKDTETNRTFMRVSFFYAISIVKRKRRRICRCGY